MYDNVRHGNAVLSATNGLFTNLLQGNAALTVTNPIFAQPVPGTTGGIPSVFTLEPAASTNSTLGQFAIARLANIEQAKRTTADPVWKAAHIGRMKRRWANPEQKAAQSDA